MTKTDKLMIEALKWCVEGNHCGILTKDGTVISREQCEQYAIDLISRLEAKIETLEANLEWCRGTGIKPMSKEE